MRLKLSSTTKDITIKAMKFEFTYSKGLTNDDASSAYNFLLL